MCESARMCVSTNTCVCTCLFEHFKTCLQRGRGGGGVLVCCLLFFLFFFLTNRTVPKVWPQSKLHHDSKLCQSIQFGQPLD